MAEFFIRNLSGEDGYHTVEAVLEGVSTAEYNRIVEFFIDGILLSNYRYLIPADISPDSEYSIYIDNLAPLIDETSTAWTLSCGVYKLDDLGDPDYDKEVFYEELYASISVDDGVYLGSEISTEVYPNSASRNGINQIFPIADLQIQEDGYAYLYAETNPGYIFDGWYEDEGVQNFWSWTNPRRRRLRNASQYHYMARAKKATVDIFDTTSDSFTVACSALPSAAEISSSEIEDREEREALEERFWADAEDVNFYINVYNVETKKFVLYEALITADEFFYGYTVEDLEPGTYAVNLGMMQWDGGDAHTNRIQWIAKAGSSYEAPQVTIEAASYTLTIRHRRETITQGTYEIYETIQKEGIIAGTSIYLQNYAKDYPGFTFNSTKTDTSEIVITSDKTVSIYYTRNWYNITFKGDNVTEFQVNSQNHPNTTVSTNGALGFAYGEEVTVQAIPASGYAFESWTLSSTNDSSSSTIEILTFLIPNTHATLTATMIKSVAPIEQWVWNLNEKEAFSQQGDFSILKASRWNDFLEWCNTVIAYKGGTKTISSNWYGTAGQPLEASDFKNIMECLTSVASIASYVPRSPNVGDVIEGRYFTELARAMNALI